MKSKGKPRNKAFDQVKGCVVLVAVVVIGIMAVQNGGNKTVEALPTVMVLPTLVTPMTNTPEVVAAAATVTDVLVGNAKGFITMTPLPGTVQPTATITDTPDVAPSATSRPTVIPARPPDEVIAEYVKAFAPGTVVSVKVVDGRANGGERAAMIAYVYQGSTTAEIAGEIGSIFGAVAGGMKAEPIAIDSVTIIYGASPDATEGVAVLQTADIVAYLNGALTEEQLWSRVVFTDFSINTSRAAPQQQTFTCPANCDEAVARGLSASQAASCGLDRDGDGVACYGE